MYDVKPTTITKGNTCGAACMVSFLDYYDVKVTLEEMIKECNVTIAGSTGKTLMQVARNHGLTEMKAFKMDAEEVAVQDRPSICWWKYNHWVICCGIDEDGKVVVCNPSRGRYGMSMALFKAFYSGVALFSGEPGPDISKTE